MNHSDFPVERLGNLLNKLGLKSSFVLHVNCTIPTSGMYVVTYKEFLKLENAIADNVIAWTPSNSFGSYVLKLSKGDKLTSRDSIHAHQI